MIPAGVDPGINIYRSGNLPGAITGNIKTRRQIFGEPINGKQDFNLQFRLLHDMFLAHGTQSTPKIVDNGITVENQGYLLIEDKRKSE